MADVFISYSRKDIAFARRLHQALSENAIEAWIDWEDIPPSTEWLAEIYEAIEQTDAFIFIVSHTSAESSICKMELEHAIKNNKRLIPVVIDEVEPAKLSTVLTAINWIFFRKSNDFRTAFDDLIVAIKTDFDWVNKHTRLQVRALEWSKNSQKTSYLLRGRDLNEAVLWQKQGQGKEPLPTVLQGEYLRVSRKVANRRRQLVFGITATAIMLFTIAVTATLMIRADAAKREKIALLNADLLIASQEGDLEEVAKTIIEGADMNTATTEGQNPLHLASFYGNIEIVSLLLESGAIVNMQGPLGEVPLHTAAERGHTEVVLLLLDSEAVLDLPDNYGETPLHKAARAGNIEVASMLLAAGAEPDPISEKGVTPLYLAASKGHSEIVIKLIEFNVEVNLKQENGFTPLSQAVRNGHIDTVSILLANGAEVNTREISLVENNTALHCAAFNGYSEIAILLINSGADVNAITKLGWTPLHIAASAGHVELASLLIKHDAEVNIMDIQDATPLHFAVFYSCPPELILLLLTSGAVVNIADEHGNTPLSLAIDAGNAEVVSLLRQYGALE